MTRNHRTDRLGGSGLAEALAIPRPHHAELLSQLLGPEAAAGELPLTDLLGSLLALADGSRRKTLLPLASSTGELAFVRRGDQVLVSYYDAGPVPQIFLRDRALDLRNLLEITAAAALELGERALVPAHASMLIAERARRAIIKEDPHGPPTYLLRRAGSMSPLLDTPLSFGFAVKLPPGDGHALDGGTRADVHALLFDGELWGFAHGRRVTLVRGAVFPAIARMVSAARSAVDAWEAGRPLHLKLRAGEFGIALRLRGGEATVTLAGLGGETITLTGLDLASALLPILRVAAELVRSVVSTDRAQSKNLRLSALRDEVRALRRTVRARGTQRSFTNGDPELLRARFASSPPEREGPFLSEPTGLRLSPRWRAEVEGVDAGGTFLCGDRIVITTPRSQLALARDDGELLWRRESSSIASFMAGTSLLCVAADGELTFRALEDGDVYARTRIAPRIGGTMQGIFAGPRGAPPVVVLTEGRDRLVAVDVRTGGPRWRFRSPGRGDFRLARKGRILLVVSGDSTLDAIDTATGEVAWRWSDLGRISMTPTVTRDHALAIAQLGSGAAALLCFDLFSGQLLFRKELAAAPATSPLATERLAILAAQHDGGPTLSALDLVTGAERWRVADPGIGDGGAAMVVDQNLVVNAASGCATALELATGALVWQQRLSDPTRDDVPRRLEPVLRGGALFLPSASVHVVRPLDGSLIGGPISDRIIPDFMRVDERGWLFIAEESGLVEAHAPIPTLRLVKS
ncbi:MAG: PQQ-binding-like beta-propeller repeat protein [Polyangiales bacterium]